MLVHIWVYRLVQWSGQFKPLETTLQYYQSFPIFLPVQTSCNWVYKWKWVQWLGQFYYNLKSSQSILNPFLSAIDLNLSSWLNLQVGIVIWLILIQLKTISKYSQSYSVCHRFKLVVVTYFPGGYSDWVIEYNLKLSQSILNPFLSAVELNLYS